MRRLSPLAANLQISFDNSLTDEFNELGFADSAEVDQEVPDSSPYFNRTDSLFDPNSIDMVNPPNSCSLPIEDPILTYDEVVTQMITNGVEWIPPNQIGKCLSEVRLTAPDPTQSNNAEVTSSPEVALANAHVKPPDLANNTTPVHHPNSDANDSGVSANVSKLLELQVQLNQEKATRKHQDDYIQQLQRYYDNLLAKHAAAEMTIDHLRFQVRAGCDDSAVPATSAPPPTAPNNNNSSSFPTLRGRKLISASLDTCTPIALARRPYQPNVSGSLMTFNEKSTPMRFQGSPNENQKSLIQPQAHLMSLNSSANHLKQHKSNGAVLSATTDHNHNTATYADDTASCSDDNDHFNEDDHPNKIVDPVTRDEAKSLEEQLKASLIGIHNRLNAVEANRLSDHRNKELAAIRQILEDIRRRYQAGYYPWLNGGLFDSQAAVGSFLDSLSQRLRQASACTRDGSGDNSTPTRPSSLNIVDPRRSASDNSNSTSAHAITTGSLHKSSSSSSDSVDLNSANALASLPSPNSPDTVEAHFIQLLTRYNKLKVIRGHEKEVESLIQRMLQLSHRYSVQSSVISRPKSLRRMFESDYGIINSVKSALIASPSSKTSFQVIVSKAMKDACTTPRQMTSPDSGVVQTPLGSSDSSYRRGYSVRQSPTTTVMATVNETPTDSQRKQSDSGFSATESCSAFVPKTAFKGGQASSFSSSTAANADEGDVGANVSRPSKMLPNEVMSLEADIQRLRQSIARLTSTASVSPAPRYIENGTGISSSGSTCGENLQRKGPRRPTDSNMKSSAIDRSSRRSRHSSTSIKQPRLPFSSSSSGEDAAYSTYNRPRPSSKSRHHGDTMSLEVIGSALNPQQRTLAPGSARSYHRTSSKNRVRSKHIEDIGYATTPSHRRSRSSTDQRAYCHPCGRCGGSGYNLNTMEHLASEETCDSPVHSRTVSDSYTMPARVIYEYGQTPWIRLPVQQDFNGWTERVYGIQELYGSAVPSQVGRAYNTIGHHPTSNLRSYSNQSQCSWIPRRQPLVVPATRPSLIPQRASRRTRRYLASSTSHSLHLDNDDAESSSSKDETRDVSVLPTSRSFCTHQRRRSSSRQTTTELEDLSSAGSSAYAAARCVTQMAHQLNSKLMQHRDRHHTSVR